LVLSIEIYLSTFKILRTKMRDRKDPYTRDDQGSILQSQCKFSFMKNNLLQWIYWVLMILTIS
jgi:hypothetical protein